MTPSLTLEQVRVEKYVKFVRIRGEYRFCHVSDQHADLVVGEQPEAIESAGFFKIRKDCCFVNGYSTVLNACYDVADTENLPKLFGVPLEYE